MLIIVFIVRFVPIVSFVLIVAFIVCMIFIVVFFQRTPEFIPRKMAIVVRIKHFKHVFCGHFFIMVIIMVVAFHPHVASCFTLFFG